MLEKIKRLAGNNSFSTFKTTITIKHHENALEIQEPVVTQSTTVPEEATEVHESKEGKGECAVF
jgi:hypothetical protein